jgi:hypothetical protein
MSLRQVQLIETDLTRRGTGEGDSCVRIVHEWWTLDGELVCEKDEWLLQLLDQAYDAYVDAAGTRACHGLAEALAWLLREHEKRRSRG